jgi:hypothetical protein
MEVAAYDKQGNPSIHEWTKLADLRMARCALGCGGIILSVTFRCVPRYTVVERVVMHDSLDAVLAEEVRYPLQEFALVPYLWRWIGYHRAVESNTATALGGWLWRALYRLYKLIVIDVLFHGFLTTLLTLHALGRRLSAWCDRFTPVMFLGTTSLLVAPAVWLTRNGVVDDSDHALTRKHYYFRHVETEVFIPKQHITDAARLLHWIVECSRANAHAGRRSTHLAAANLISKHRGTYTHHYPLLQT